MQQLCVSVNCSYVPCASPRSGQDVTGHLTPLAAGIIWLHSPSCLPPSPCNNPQTLRFCFFGFDGLRFDWSSSNRFGGYGGSRGWLFFYFFLTDTRRVGQCFRFTWITVHFLGFASYLFALLLFREEPLRGLKNLCSLLCLEKWETTTENTAVLPKPVNQFQFKFFEQSQISFPILVWLKPKYLTEFQLLMNRFLPISKNILCNYVFNIQRSEPPPTTFRSLPSYKITK